METKPRICEPPNDGREWILADDAAALFCVTRNLVLMLAKRFDWTRYQQPQKQTWILKKEVVSWHNFLKDRERWYKRRRPKTWQPMISIEPKDAEPDFPRYWWTTAQAADFMGVSKNTICVWVKKGKIPVFTTRKMGQGRRYWYSPTSLRNLKESEEWQKGRAIWEKIKAAMRQGIVAREAYTARHPPYIYQDIPPGWITMREVAERLDISIANAHHLRKKKRFLSEQFVGEWDKKCRPWFCDEDGVERLKNDEEYQKLRRRGLQTRENLRGKLCEKPAVEPAPQDQRSPQDRSEPTFGYTSEELRLPRERITSIDEMW